MSLPSKSLPTFYIWHPKYRHFLNSLQFREYRTRLLPAALTEGFILYQKEEAHNLRGQDVYWRVNQPDQFTNTSLIVVAYCVVNKTNRGPAQPTNNTLVIFTGRPQPTSYHLSIRQIATHCSLNVQQVITVDKQPQSEVHEKCKHTITPTFSQQTI